MLQQVILQASTPLTLNVEGAEPDDQVVVKSITGLDPADVTLFMGDFARDGGYYQGRRSGGRNPVITLKINPDYAADVEVSDIREMLYSIFMEPNSPLAPNPDGLYVKLIDDRKPDRYFIGYVEKAPSDIFSRDTSMQVSMLCPEPFLLSVDEVTGSDATGWTTLPVTYEGSARTGLEVTIKAKAALTQMIFEINGQQMILNRNFALNDVVTINTVIGSRSIKVGATDIMAALNPASRWLQLNKGVNTIKVGGAAIGDAGAALMSYKYRAAWWGI